MNKSYPPAQQKVFQRLVLSVNWLILFINANKSGKALISKKKKKKKVVFEPLPGISSMSKFYKAISKWNNISSSQ